jgi:hypothetical protein
MADVPGYIRRNEYLKKILSDTVRILSFHQQITPLPCQHWSASAKMQASAPWHLRRCRHNSQRQRIAIFSTSTSNSAIFSTSASASASNIFSVIYGGIIFSASASARSIFSAYAGSSASNGMQTTPQCERKREYERDRKRDLWMPAMQRKRHWHDR